MSYILDALKKSEQERGHGNIPDVQTVHSSSLNYRSEKKSYWPYILILAVILNLLAIVYFNYDKSSDKTTSTNNPLQSEEAPSHEQPKPETMGLKAMRNQQPAAATQPPVAVEPESEPAMKQRVMNNPVLPNQNTGDAGKTSTGRTSTEKNTGKTAEEVSHTPLDTEGNADSGKNTNTNTGMGTPAQKQGSVVTATTDNEIIEFYDLPDSVASQLPGIVISAHVYSTNPKQRSIVINNKFLEEGDYVIDDLILYEITRDGAIFLYNGILFRYGVVSSWQ